jgi:hypothetical protein
MANSVGPAIARSAGFGSTKRLRAPKRIFLVPPAKPAKGLLRSQRAGVHRRPRSKVEQDELMNAGHDNWDYEWAVMHKHHRTPWKRMSKSTLLPVVRVADLLHPVDVLAVERFLHRDMRHCGRWRCAVPVLLAGWEEHDIPRPNFLKTRFLGCGQIGPLSVAACP